MTGYRWSPDPDQLAERTRARTSRIRSERADRMREVRKADPLAVLGQRYWPESPPPLLDDGTVDVRALCARWDAAANVGAGEPR